MDFLKGLGGALGGVTNLLSGGGLIDAAGSMLGLPPAITNAAKVAAGAMTGNVLLAADGAMGLVGELSKNPPAATEYSAPKDAQKACAGYAKPEHGASAVPGGGQAWPGGSPVWPGGSPVSSGSQVWQGGSSAGTGGSQQAGGITGGSHLDPKMNDYFHSLQTLEQNFRYLDATDGKLDGSLSKGDLHRISGDGRVSPELRQAARFMVDNPGYFERLDTSVGAFNGSLTGVFKDHKNDDRITLGNVRSEILKVKADFAQYGRPGNVGSSAPPPPGGSVGSQPPTSGTPSSGSSSGSASSGVRGIVNDPSMSMEEKIEAILSGLTEKLDDEILKTMDDLAAAQDQKAGISNEKGNEKKAADADRNIEKLNLRLQKLIERRKNMFEMASTLSMKFNEMAKTALSNMRSA
ncbi:hypothetical protein [Vitiosangium sp. GDMCC 1.1324]|uniref:hypothetical protein n=1 Tax=Vitiosangium sp. (strain GDMCC 1.1324) TaxID=2138576 RepID=UPI000D3A4AF3|nr:hypothetical protein [Vitiosangium sp. GDMCC 1.1324]PTL78587.1 hypothetical protein DAT35_39400 [Vitiosangium sp. GDMCC 1.1324]